MIIINRVIGCIIFICILMLCRLLLFPMKNIFMLKNRNKIMIGFWISSLVFTIIGYFTNSIISENPADYIGFVWLGINAFFVFSILLLRLCDKKIEKKEKKKAIFVNINKEDYKLHSETDLIGKDVIINKYALWNNNGENKIIHFSGAAPIEPINIIAELLSVDEKTYNGISFIELEKKTLKEKVFSIIDIYMSILILYALYQICRHGLRENKIGLDLVIMPMMYFLTKFVKQSFENDISSYGKFMKIVFNTFYWILLVMLILYPFI